ncbi:SpoIIIAH-like family protein [Clostridium estertheticum]|uniref:SpoIIIAH-like family protein n=1 Tax=Clostridium estertheticum TaxID=238834 RepID=UPI0013E935B9|nr:SpoIIIAH-like family protein [Clostridium estertheticum]MBZ9686354.1 SpoIIIAH-like family protein [Clostridium estertheticum]
MESNLKLNKYFTIMLGIIFVLGVFVIYQASIINKLKNKQTSEFFLETKLKRDQSSAKTLQSLKELMDNGNISKEVRAIAASKYINIVVAANNESQIELLLKNKGYDEVVAIITDDRVRLIIKHDNKLSKSELNEIRDTVMSVTKIGDIEVEIK